MPARKKSADLPRKALKTTRAAAIKGGRKQRLGQGTLSSSRKRDRLAGNHNQTLRTRA